MKASVTLGTWEELGAAARAVRYEVFVLEQGVPLDLEQDEADPVCLHALACDEHGQALGTGRLLPDGHIGRMAVRKAARGGGIGAAMLAALTRQAELRGDRAVVLNAQVDAERFYARHGFVRDGEVFMEAGIEHVRMRKSLAPTPETG